MTKNSFTIFLFLLVGIFSRLMLHIPDVTPLTALCLLAPTVFSKRLSMMIIFLILVLSDFLLHITSSIPIIGSWTVFTYSGWLLIALSCFLLKENFSMTRGICFSGIAALFFWVWTNFGTWVCGTLYAHTATGLIECYLAALPFLRNGVLGDILWMTILTIPTHSLLRRDKSTSLQQVRHF